MPGEFYTERDIEDLIRSGHTSLQLKEGDRLTDLARERARQGGLRLAGPHESSSQVARQASAVRYAQESKAKSKSKRAAPAADVAGTDLHQRIKSSVRAKVGASVDEQLLDRIISRVLDQMGLS